MIIVGINGGLGNQMFQYALYLKLKSLGKAIFIDDQIIVNRLNDSKALKIFDVFDLQYNKCTRALRNKMADVSMDSLSRVRRKIFGTKEFNDTYYVETDFNDNYKPQIFKFDNIYLNGYWQTEKYFQNIRDDILKNYSFTIEDDSVEGLLNIIRNTQSVSIHIRRGDYINNGGYDGVCTDAYYDAATEYIKQHVSNPVFYIFSDDKEYVRKKYQGKEYVIIEGFTGNKAHYDMYLMTQCKHNIVANSSFSWWGAWLNQNEDKIVVCPKRWNTKSKLVNTPCDSWIKI